MDDCCKPSSNDVNMSIHCPVCQRKGKIVPIITLNAMLKPFALETIDAELTYTFCSTTSCEVVYFINIKTFGKDTLKVPVFQKDEGLKIPVCYCFEWTRERLKQTMSENISPTEHIRSQIQKNRCGCEVNNPQGSCCLGNVTAYLSSK
jgi:hypothetical protein